MIGDLIQACQERMSLGQKNMQQLYDHLSGLNELELQSRAITIIIVSVKKLL